MYLDKDDFMFPCGSMREFQLTLSKDGMTGYSYIPGFSYIEEEQDGKLCVRGL